MPNFHIKQYSFTPNIQTDLDVGNKNSVNKDSSRAEDVLNIHPQMEKTLLFVPILHANLLSVQKSSVQTMYRQRQMLVRTVIKKNHFTYGSENKTANG